MSLAAPNGDAGANKPLITGVVALAMDHDRFRQLMDVFEAAAAMPAAERPGYLAEACAGDDELRKQVEDMLRADETGESGLDEPGAGAALVAGEVARPAGSRVAQPMPVLSNDYSITRIIGEGGMGTVYEAEQARPRRMVALKAIRPGLGSARMLRRLMREAEILGGLNHPGIAQVYEVGAADEDSPEQAFIAMELVRGEALTTFVDQRTLAIRERVELIARVCEAVGHAHEEGVVHRDLKPANILVEPDGRPRVLDFGVASIESGLTAHTEAGGLVGTLACMSPEQVRGEDVDARADVYALGVLLYRALTGRPPHDLAGLGITAAARVIEEELPAPVGEVDRRLKGDLESIVSHATAKHAEDRYADATAMERDLRQFLAGEAVAAGMTLGGGTRAIRWVRRRQRTILLWLGVGAIVVVALLAGYLIGKAGD